jgi:hypothetical protein
MSRELGIVQAPGRQEARMVKQDQGRTLPGRSILGGAAAGLSYEGARADPLAREERERRREAGRLRVMPAPQLQPARPSPPPTRTVDQ